MLQGYSTGTGSAGRALRVLDVMLIGVYVLGTAKRAIY